MVLRADEVGGMLHGGSGWLGGRCLGEGDGILAAKQVCTQACTQAGRLAQGTWPWRMSCTAVRPLFCRWRHAPCCHLQRRDKLRWKSSMAALLGREEPTRCCEASAWQVGWRAAVQCTVEGCKRGLEAGCKAFSRAAPLRRRGAAIRCCEAGIMWQSSSGAMGPSAVVCS